MPQKVTKIAATKRGRSFGSIGPSSKKRKLAPQQAASTNGKKGKQLGYERTTIPLPDIPSDDDENLSDQDVQFYKDNPAAGSFLDDLDRTGIARSKKEIERLHNLSKPPRVRPSTDGLPSLDSNSDGEDEWSDHTDISSIILSEDNSEGELDDVSSSFMRQETNFDSEQPYERKPRIREKYWDENEAKTVPRLPVKLPDGRIVKTGGRVIHQSENEIEGPSHKQEQPEARAMEDVPTGGRFGRLAVANVVGTSSRQARIQMAQEQIAGICQDILADPENSLGLLRRLHTFTLIEIPSPQSHTPIPNDPFIRRLAMVSELAVLKDVIPGYRIRPLTNAEKAEKVSQIVARTREWEQGLVSAYQTYLRALESELKGHTGFAELALKSMCTLLTEATHFNFRTNLMGTIVARLSKKSWDASSELCLKTVETVFKKDVTGVPSLEIVRLLNRMIKERKFAVHPDALSCLLHLRLKTELGGIRASETKAEKDLIGKGTRESRSKADRKRAKGKKVETPHMSKKSIKVLKERRDIEEQMQEAEAEVDREEKANMHTETLKLLFVLYFRILKAPHWTPLLPSALQGLSRYAHMVNVDFFKDLMQVLKDLMTRMPDGTGAPESDQPQDSKTRLIDHAAQHRLLCIVTAFELLSGQGEALRIDLRDFVNHLYALIPPISFQPDIESVPNGSVATRNSGTATQHSTASLLFRALTLVFPARSSKIGSPVRAAAFAKRILVASLSFPTATTLRSLEFVAGLIVCEPKLQALLSTEDRSANGMYRPELDDPELSNAFATSFWEITHLAETHWDVRVREKAYQLMHLNST